MKYNLITLNEFVETFFKDIADEKGLENIKQCIKDNVYHNYDTTKVNFQLSNEEDSYDLEVSVTSNSYCCGEIIDLDFKISE